VSDGGLIELTAIEAAERIANGDLASEEYTAACLEQIAAVDGTVRAFAHLDPDEALRQARALDEHRRNGKSLGPLHGVPVAIKDIFDTEDMPTEDGSAFLITAARGKGRDALLGARVPIGDGIAGWVAARGEALVLEGEVKDERFAPLHPRAEIQSALCMPMITRGKLVGVLNVNCTRARRAFTLGQIKVLSIFTNAAAAGIESARLHEEQRRADARYREVLHMAADGIISVDEEQRSLQ